MKIKLIAFVSFFLFYGCKDPAINLCIRNYGSNTKIEIVFKKGSNIDATYGMYKNEIINNKSLKRNLQIKDTLFANVEARDTLIYKLRKNSTSLFHFPTKFVNKIIIDNDTINDTLYFLNENKTVYDYLLQDKIYAVGIFRNVKYVIDLGKKSSD